MAHEKSRPGNTETALLLTSSDTTNTGRQYSHLYYEYWKCWEGCWTAEPHDCYAIMACPVTRITAKRIYFRDSADHGLYRCPGEMYIDRAVIERGGDQVGQLLSNGGYYHGRLRQILHLEPPQKRESQTFRRLVKCPAGPTKTVPELRKEAADLHPDRGGDPAAFRVAYARYARAKVVAR
jgi:hypothetical protein